ncbi:MAG TPA: hypothetical protein PLK61_04160 [Nitrosomonas sp.]|nr:hypothetical protein [Nitrosomonas sp.]
MCGILKMIDEIDFFGKILTFSEIMQDFSLVEIPPKVTYNNFYTNYNDHAIVILANKNGEKYMIDKKECDEGLCETVKITYKARRFESAATGGDPRAVAIAYHMEAILALQEKAPVALKSYVVPLPIRLTPNQTRD